MPLNKAAALLRVHGLKHWLQFDWSKGYYGKGLSAIKMIALDFLFKGNNYF